MCHSVFLCVLCSCRPLLFRQPSSVARREEYPPHPPGVFGTSPPSPREPYPALTSMMRYNLPKAYFSAMRHSRLSSTSFTLQYFAVLGCGDPVLPTDTHVHRDKAGLMTVVCNVSRETFRLVCVGRRWTGVMQNCSKTGQICQCTFKQLHGQLTHYFNLGPYSIYILQH